MAVAKRKRHSGYKLSRLTFLTPVRGRGSQRLRSLISTFPHRHLLVGKVGIRLWFRGALGIAALGRVAVRLDHASVWGQLAADVKHSPQVGLVVV